jgi:hypothetical protein
MDAHHPHRPPAAADWSESESLPMGNGQVVSLAGDIVRSQALDFLVDHAEIASEGESLWADEDPDEDSTEAVSEPPEQDRAEERA